MTSINFIRLGKNPNGNTKKNLANNNNHGKPQAVKPYVIGQNSLLLAKLTLNPVVSTADRS